MSKVSSTFATARAGEGHQPPAEMSLVRGLIKTARPKQWAKNVLVLAAPGAAGALTQGGPLWRSVFGLVMFCVVSSGTYYLNDAIDVEADRRHPVKRNRPMAAGIFPVRVGLVIGGVLLAGGIAASAVVGWRLSVVMAVYVAVQLGYSFYLKHQPVYDLAAVAAGFVLRAIAGGVAAHVPVSEWFLIVATFGSLLMVTGKRVAEQAELGHDRAAHRATLETYSPTFLRTVLGIAATGAIVGYCLWAFSLQTALAHHADPIWYQLSIVPMIVALLRYTFLVEGGRGARPEDLVFSDRSLQVLGLVWAVLFALGVYAS
ncbi:MAG: decaprenyl-phosphate phosphoribosyltransferase [Actinomycetota bacterium]|nr:decaprenyl-phosphate phosphoribosyltransferase [Actinomycetota bacterium]